MSFREVWALIRSNGLAITIAATLPQFSFGQAGWTASYIGYELSSQDGAPLGIFPDGRQINFDTTLGVAEQVGTWTDASGTQYSAIFLADGGKVIFSSGIPIKLIDPYGQITTIVYDPVSKTTRITEPGGRFLQVDWGTSPFDNSLVILSVEAYDGTGPGGKANLLGSVAPALTHVLPIEAADSEDPSIAPFSLELPIATELLLHTLINGMTLQQIFKIQLFIRSSIPRTTCAPKARCARSLTALTLAAGLLTS